MQSKREGTIEIPELEALVGEYAPRNRLWSEEEDAILRTYYGRVPPEAIAEVLAKMYPPGRTATAVKSRGGIINRD